MARPPGQGTWTGPIYCVRLTAAFRELPHVALLAPKADDDVMNPVAASKAVHVDPAVLFAATAAALGHNSPDKRFLLTLARMSASGTRGDIKEYRLALDISTSTLKRRRKALCQRVADYLNAQERRAGFQDLADLFAARSALENESEK